MNLMREPTPSPFAPRRFTALPSLGRLAIAFIFTSTGVLHFLHPDGFVRIVPHFLPAPRALVFASGACEVLLGLGVLLPLTRAAAGIGLIALLVAVFPANIQMLLDARAAGTAAWWQAALWGRLPLQAALAVWVFRVTNPRHPRG